MKNKSYEKYREAKERIKKGENLVVIIDDDVSLVSTKMIKEGQRRWEEYQKLNSQKPN